MSKFDVVITLQVEAEDAKTAFYLVRQEYAIAHDPTGAIASVDFTVDSVDSAIE